MSGIGRNVKRALRAYEESDYEASAAAIFPAVDATGKKRFPAKGSGVRFRGIIEQQQDLITFLAIGNVIIGGSFYGKTMPEALWHFARCPLLHEAELDRRISFSNTDSLAIGETWNLPPSFLLGIIVSVVAARENLGETEVLTGVVRFGSDHLDIQTLWGGEDFLRAIIYSYTGRSR